MNDAAMVAATGDVMENWKLRTVLVGCALVALAGCSTAPHQLADKGETRVATVVDAPEVVYRKVVQGMRTCYSRWEIVADFFPSERVGRVSFSSKTSLSIHALLVVDVSPGPEGGTRLQITHLRGVPALADAVQSWTRGETSCPLI